MKLVFALVAAIPLWASWNAHDSRDIEAVRAYRTWKEATKGWCDMAPSLWVLCSGPSATMQHPNPHVPRMFRVFVNAKGKQAMADPQKAFPVGTVIVKEKYPRNPKEGYGKITVDKSKPPELLTVMSKRLTGWEYYSLSGDLKEIARDNGTCRKCHESQKATDYVFRDYGHLIR